MQAKCNKTDKQRKGSKENERCGFHQPPVGGSNMLVLVAPGAAGFSILITCLSSYIETLARCVVVVVMVDVFFSAAALLRLLLKSGDV